MKDIVLGTAGHIDHGKSALVLALTGSDPDRLQEEKRRGITIDLGFAHLDLGGGLRAAFIDVPGHERFVKNMLAGATGIDAVILVVAADESIKPQTREHFEICRLLGIRRGLVAITKSDLVDRDILDLVRLEIQDFITGSFLEGAALIPVSARTGEGLDALKAELRRQGQEITGKPVSQPFRLPIDRAFVMKGFGSVVTGTLIAGKVEKEAEVEILPTGRRVRVRGLEVHNQAVDEAQAGQRTALNLAGVEVKEIRRGMMLARPGEFQATDRLDGALTLLPSARPLKNHARVHFHCWTADTIAEVALLDGNELQPGERAYAQLRLAEPGLFLPGDRFIVRQFSPVITIGGGIVLDNFPARHRSGDPAAREFLKALAGSEPEARLELLLRALGEESIPPLVARTGWPAAEILRIAATLAEKKQALILGQPPSQLLHRSALEGLSKDILHALTSFHAAQPLVQGMSKEELRGQARLGSREGSPLAFNAALGALTGAGKIGIKDETVFLAGRGIQLNAEEQAAKEQISQAFEKAGLKAPSAEEVLASLHIDRARAQKILQILLKEKTLRKITEGLIFHHSALENLRKMLQRHKVQSERINVSAFKELTGISRKYAIPLLEYLDRERVTRRVGDERVIL
ncbi:MAG TPA: selenocysteine-specific translation elongation factor [Terriglobia bacterium]|nr:selenocysteine-specific translation elongation factor [Terriglobia bacterium]